MNKLYILLLLLLVFAGRAIGQDNIKATVGTPFPDTNFDQIFYVNDKSGFLIVTVLDSKLILQKIGTDLKPQKVMQYENFPKDFIVQRVFILRNKCFLFYSATTKKLPSLFVAQVDVAKGELLDGGKEIILPSDDIDNDFIYGDAFHVMFSRDSSHIAVCYKIKSSLVNKSKNGEVNGVWVFDDKLTERWHAELVLPYTERRTKVLDRAIDNNGNIHLALRVIKDDSGLERKSGQTTPNYSIELHSYQSPSEPPKVTNFDLNDKFLNSLSLDVVDGRLNCSGFYNSKASDSEAEGIFAANLPSQPGGTTIFHPFTLSFMNEGEKSQKQKSNEKLVAKGKALEMDLRLIRTIPQADGGMILFGQQHKEITQYTPGSSSVGGAGGVGGIGRGDSYTPVHVYFNLIVAQLLPDGKLGWIRRLSKGSESTSFTYTKKHNTHNLLFVEEEVLFEYKLNDVTGEDEKKELIKFKPLLKRPHAFFTSNVGGPMPLPEGHGVLFVASLSGDAGKFGEKKPYREDVLVKVIIE